MVNPDSIRLALHGNAFIPESEAMVWVMAKYMVRSLHLAGHNTVILDATNTTKKRRDEWKNDHWVTLFRVFDETKEECLKRAAKTRRFDLSEVIESMAEKFEPLDDDERNMILGEER